MAQSLPYRGPQDVEPMKEFLVSARADTGHGCWHVGDLVWRLFLHSIRHDLAKTVRLWWDKDDRLHGFAIVSPPTATGTVRFDLQVHPQVRGQGLEESMLDWIEAFGVEAIRDVLDAPGLWLATDTGVYENDASQIAALLRRGFQPGSDDAWLLLRSLAEPIPTPRLPDGFSVRAVAGPHEIHERASAHRDAFHPSRVADEAYLRLMQTPGYAQELDLVAVAADGTCAAFCLGWLDMVNRVGEFEPMGSRSPFRRKGLAQAVLLEGLHRMRGQGAESVVVGPISIEEQPALGLYHSVGFRPIHRVYSYLLGPLQDPRH